MQDTVCFCISELVIEISHLVGRFGKWLPISFRRVFVISCIGILTHKYVSLDTKITILSELQAEILKSLYFGRPFWKMAATEASGKTAMAL